MHNFIELAKEEVPQLEDALKKIDVLYRLDMEKRQKEGRPMNRREQMQQEEKAKKKAK